MNNIAKGWIVWIFGLIVTLIAFGYGGSEEILFLIAGVAACAPLILWYRAIHNEPVGVKVIYMLVNIGLGIGAVFISWFFSLLIACGISTECI